MEQTKLGSEQALSLSLSVASHLHGYRRPCTSMCLHYTAGCTCLNWTEVAAHDGENGLLPPAAPPPSAFCHVVVGSDIPETTSTCIALWLLLHSPELNEAEAAAVAAIASSSSSSSAPSGGVSSATSHGKESQNGVLSVRQRDCWFGCAARRQMADKNISRPITDD